MRRWAVIGGLLAFLLLAYYVQSIDHGGTQTLISDPNDGDGDGWSDGYEFNYIGTSPMMRCEPDDYLPGRVGAWPPDFNNDRFIDIYDIGIIAGRFGTLVDYWTPEERRFDIYGEPMGDGVIDINELGIVAGLYGTECGSG